MSENNIEENSENTVLKPTSNGAHSPRCAHILKCTSVRGCAPTVVGILNVTPDSFSDGGSYPTVEAAVEAAKSMCAAGASIIDVGGESTRPGFTEVSEAEEISRTVEVITRLTGEGITVSIDTRHPRVAQAALEAGAHILNDIDGFRDPRMIRVAADAGCACIVMSNASHAKEIASFWNNQTDKLLAAGISRDCIIVDPGFGFGKDAQENAQLMRDLPQLVQDCAFPVLVGVSRKRWIGKTAGITDAPKRDAATLGADLFAASAGAAYLRVHNVAETLEGLATYWPLIASKPKRALIALGSEVGAVSLEREKTAGAPGDAETKLANMKRVNAERAKEQTEEKEPGTKAHFDPASFKGKSFDELQYASSLSHLKEALKAIDALPFTSTAKTSSIYVSEGALGVENPVLNAVIEVKTSLLPFALLQNLLQIEASLGRGRPHPRTIDLDLLWVEGQVQQTPTLTLPHPGIGMRHFVLRPLAEVIGPPCHFLKDIGIELAPKDERIGPIIKKLAVPLS